MHIEIPRKQKDSILTAADWNNLVGLVERFAALTVDASSGLQMIDSSVGRVLSFVGGDTPIAYINLTVDLAAGDGISKLGHGQGKVLGFTPGSPGGSDTGSLVTTGDSSLVDVYNLANGIIKSASTIIAFRSGDGSWHYLFTVCTNVK